VNRRFVRDTTLMHAIAEAYSGLLTAGRKPVCFVLLTLDPGSVDVNVHPTKLEIKFRRPHEVHQQVLSALRDALRGASLTPQVVLTADQPAAPPKEFLRQAISDFLAARPDEEVPRRTAPAGARGAPAPMPGRTALAAPSPAPGPAPEFRPRFGNCLQVLDTYIVEEAGDAIHIVDQHALHERILYSRMTRQLAEGNLASQQLLVPELVELPMPEFYAVMDLQEDLARFGMEIAAFGERTVIVRSFPQVLGRFDGPSFFRDLLNDLQGPEEARKVDGRLEKLVRIMACRGAVKAGQRLSPEQMRQLLEQRHDAGPTDTCPHGRPTTIKLTRQELDKQFHRT